LVPKARHIIASNRAVVVVVVVVVVEGQGDILP